MVNPRIKFKIKIKTDAWNHWATANSKDTWGIDFTKRINPKILKKIKEKPFEEVQDYLFSTLKNNYSRDNDLIKKRLTLIKKNWKNVEKEYFKRLKKITKNKIYTNNFYAVITTVGRCPYFLKDDAFMIYIHGDLDRINTGIAHELMHLQFHYYYEDFLREIISKEDFHHIKEALTVLLNIEFGDLITHEDMGYPSHQRLREFISEQWKETKDLNIVIERCIGNLKELIN